jgi:hypothetical protein
MTERDGGNSPWFSSYAFPFWVMPVSWQGWVLEIIGVPMTMIPAYLSLTLYDAGGLPFRLAAATFIIMSGALITLAYLHTERH